MTQVIIDDVIPRTQLIAAAGQTVFNTNWTANATTDILVYARADGVEPDDETQLVSSSDYNVTFIGGSQTVRVTFLVGRTLDDVITIVRNTPAERLNLYINTNFVPSMLNEDFGILTLVDQQAQMYDTVVTPHYNVSATIDPDSMLGGGDVILPILPPKFGWRKNAAGTAIEAISIPDGGFAPADATYLIQVADVDLPNAQAMAALASGFVVNTTSTGVQLTRTLEDTANQIVITNQDGIAGNPAWSISPDVILPGVEGMGLIRGTTAQRPVTPGSNTFFRFNTDDEYLEYWDGTNWIQLIEDAGVLIIHGTANQIDVDSTDPAEPILSLSATLDAPGTFTIQGSTAVDEIINDDTMATATATNLATALSIKNYVDGLDSGSVKSVTGTANEIDVDNTDPQNPILSLSSTLIAPGTIAVGNLLFDTNTISSTDTNGDLILTPDGTGNLVLDGLNWPQADGTAGYVLATDGAGQLSWVVQSSGNPGGLDTQIQYNNSGAFAGDTGFTTDGAGNLVIVGSLNIDNIEINGNTISSTDTNGDLNLTPDGTGNLVLDGVNWPQADGTAGYFLQTDGAGQTSWQPVSGGSGTVTAASINEIAFYPANGDTVDGIPTANSAMFRTDASGVPGWSASMTDGQIMIGDTSGTPVPGNITAGPGISIANGPGTIQISGTGSGIGWTEVTGTSQSAVADNGYVTNNAGLVTVTLPTTAAFGTAISIIGKGAGGWLIAQNSGQNIQVGSVSSTVGAGGSVASTNRYDSIDLLCTTANTTWTVQGGPQTAGFTIV